MSTSGPTYGVLQTFDHQTQEWGSFKSRLNQWFIANDITSLTDKASVKRRAILLTSLCESSFKLASDLALPKKVEELEYDELVKILDDHFTPKRLGFAEKSAFYAAVQRPGESHTQWAARLRGLAAHCEFKNLEEALLDKFIMGMAAGRERDKLFVQNQRELTLAKAIDLAESVRCARQASSQAAPGASNADAASHADADAVFNIKKEKCSVCGFNNHKSNQCRFKNYKCKKCNTKGHLRKMCPNGEKIKYVDEGTVDDAGGDDGEFFYNIRCIKGKPMTERVMISGLALEFEIDSGSAVSVISENTYKSYFKELPLSVTNKKLFSYTGENIKTLGIVLLPISYNGRTEVLNVYVVHAGGPPLLGRDFIREFDLELAPANASATVHALYKQQTQNGIYSNIVKQLINQFPKVFSGNLGSFNKYKISLRLKPDAKPIFFKARPVPYALKEKIDKELDRLLSLGILKPVEHSDYASPVVPVLKKDGNIRLCADYSVTINKQLLIDQYPLPTVNDLLSKLHGGMQFSKIDLSMAYNQFILTEDSQSLTCINTHRGLFNYTRLVFGLSSAPAVFQRAMECLLSGIDGIIFLLDDILITGTNEAQHKHRLNEVLQRLADAGLTVQMSKCEFFKDEISYLGHVIDKYGIRKSLDKVKAIIKAPKPTNVSQLQSFLGLTNYYRNFVPDASSVLSPLYNLLNKNTKWEWTRDHDEAFVQIKNILASDKTLAHFDPKAKLILTVDASPTGLGAVLSQVGSDGLEKPLSYASRTLNAAEKKYAQIQKEATAIIFGIRRFHQYLYGRAEPFTLRTDHKPLLAIFGPHKGIPEVSANRLQRYAIFLTAYNYTIEYISSKQNSADYLSRACWEEGHEETSEELAECEDRATYVNFITDGDLPVTLSDMRRETARDPYLTIVIRYILNGWPRKIDDTNLKPFFNCRSQLSYENGILMRGHKVVIPSSLHNTICKELHSSHFGVVKMKAEARKRLWFPGVDAALEGLAAACGVCCALRPAPPHAALAPWPLPPHPFYRIHVDFLGPFHGYMFLIIVDAYSKWVECYDMSSTYNSKAVINKMYDLMSRFGIPHTLVSDNGTSFTSGEFNDFCKRNGIQHVLSPVYHPASNGQAESFVKIVKKGIKGIILEGCNKKTIQEKINKFLFDYRNSKNSTTDQSPAELVYGRSLRSRLDLINPVAPPPSSTELNRTVELKQSLQAKYYKGIKRAVYKENDCVWITKNTDKKKFTWLEGKIKKKIGHVMYVVYVPVLNCEVTRHIDQIRPRRDTISPRLDSAQSSDQSWDPDLIPDVSPSPPAADQGDTVAQPGRDGEVPAGPNQGEIAEAPKTPPRAADAAERRRAISPIFSTPTSDSYYDTDVDT
ncbi:hypothetical protein PYW07_003100 [Mythimna separata]|uniref:RNA-directed DNA polymerase n=1 Tax=Mythimna separata TaxID=271217 RepID=A0AAD7YJ04_MYTSE|nr:hypothetical protein PYW07_003100 [Mythimna separata]